MWQIRNATQGDATALVAECWQTTSLESAIEKLALMELLCEKQRGLALVTTHNARIIGYGQVMLWRGVGEIADLQVVAAWRGQGIGTALIRALEAQSEAWGWRRLEIGVTKQNVRAYALYERLGFEFAYQNTYLAGETVFYLAKSLTAPIPPAE